MKSHIPFQLSLDAFRPLFVLEAIRAERPEDMCLAIARAKADALVPKVAKDALLVCMDQVGQKFAENGWSSAKHRRLRVAMAVSEKSRKVRRRRYIRHKFFRVQNRKPSLMAVFR